MKMRFSKCVVPILLTVVLNAPTGGEAQGTVTFDAHPNWGGTYYTEVGVAFQVVIPQGSSYDIMGVLPPGYSNTPQNSTPFMAWFRQYNPYDYVSVNLVNGSAFGLSSVQLADPNSPSLSPVSISFIGHLRGGLTATNTFTTPGNGATTLVTYSFNPSFASGLTSVDILAPKWAMDNLVFVPEPGLVSLLGLGALTGFARRACRPRDQ